jgi:hypothetical protein
MSTESQRTCPICGNKFSGSMEFCPVCMQAVISTQASLSASYRHPSHIPGPVPNQTQCSQTNHDAKKSRTAALKRTGSCSNIG